MRSFALGIAASVAALMSWSQGSFASTITEHFTFTATDFDVTPPVDPVTGSFTVTFDPTLTYHFGDPGAVLNSINITLDALEGPFGFSYDPALNFLFVGMNDTSVGNGHNDFEFGAKLTPGNTAAQFFYAQKAAPADIYNATQISFTAEQEPTRGVAPLPPSALMLVTGLGGLGFVGWRRKRANAA